MPTQHCLGPARCIDFKEIVCYCRELHAWWSFVTGAGWRITDSAGLNLGTIHITQAKVETTVHTPFQNIGVLLQGAPFARRSFVTGAGWRMTESAGLTAVATHHCLTELLLHLMLKWTHPQLPDSTSSKTALAAMPFVRHLSPKTCSLVQLIICY